MKMLGWMMVMVGIVFCFGCATKYSDGTTIKEYDPTGKIVLKETYENKSYQESNLRHKSIAVGGAVNAMKIVASTDSETGSIFPTVIFGFGTFFFIDLAESCSAYFNDKQKTLCPWSSSMGSETTILIMGTEFGEKVEISNPELLLDMPGLKVINPVGDVPSVKILPKDKPEVKK